MHQDLTSDSTRFPQDKEALATAIEIKVKALSNLAGALRAFAASFWDADLPWSKSSNSHLDWKKEYSFTGPQGQTSLAVQYLANGERDIAEGAVGVSIKRPAGPFTFRVGVELQSGTKVEFALAVENVSDLAADFGGGPSTKPQDGEKNTLCVSINNHEVFSTQLTWEVEFWKVQSLFNKFLKREGKLLRSEDPIWNPHQIVQIDPFVLDEVGSLFQKVVTSKLRRAIEKEVVLCKKQPDRDDKLVEEIRRARKEL
ncbi:MAG: hypothetical protein KDD70_17660 [Bdellovibrionales bacterium]|nr:hypothetical protein [Bdellovibrionales bacterium]